MVAGYLPLGQHNLPRFWKALLSKRRQALLSTILVVGLLLVGLYQFGHAVLRSVLQRPGEPGPPSWESLKKWERDLPQHNLDLPYPEGRTGRYVKFSVQIDQIGWNNVLTEMHLNAFLAYESKRAFVFPDYVWKSTHYSWSRWQSAPGSPWPPHTPMNALISGPIAGGAWDEDDDAPRSISNIFFRDACPKHETRIITTDEVKPTISSENGAVTFETWKKVLLEAPERCIEITGGKSAKSDAQIFDFQLQGSPRVLSLWDKFVRSPVSRLTRSSPIVDSAVTRNEHLFLPRGPRPPISWNPYDRMLAMHVRRGDYSSHCAHLAKWNSTFISWNQLEFLPDHFEPPAGGSWGKNTPENTATYMRKCLPSIEQIVARTRQIREEYAHTKDGGLLDVLYLMTNEKGNWLDELKAAMMQEGFSTIRTSRELELDSEQMEVNGAVDSEIARKAAVFIGNGWSSLTSIIVHGRLVDGRDPLSIRFY